MSSLPFKIECSLQCMMHDNKLGYEKLGIILALLSSMSFCVDTNWLSVAVKFSWYVVHVLCVRNMPTIACTIFGEHFTWLVQAVSRMAQVELESKVCVTFVYVLHQMHPLFCVTSFLGMVVSVHRCKYCAKCNIFLSCSWNCTGVNS